jgi:hypothetical protein
MNNNQVDQRVLLDFKYFLAYAWENLNLPKPTPMQFHIADFLQAKEKRMVLQALRGIGKTWITGAYVTWRLLRNPNEKVLIISQSGRHSDNIAMFIRKMIATMDILKHLEPRGDQRSSVVNFDVNGCEVTVQPSVKALGITSQLQGNRATLLISDDVEGQQNSATEMMRAKLLQQVAEYEAILQTDEESQILVLGTPQSSESIYNGLRDKGYLTRIFPARYPEDIDVYQGCLAPYIHQDLLKDPTLIGKSIDTRFTDEDLTNREVSYGRSGFKLQFMLDTTLSDAERYPLKLHDLIVTDISPTEAPLKLGYSSSLENRYNEIPNIGFTGDGFYRPSFISEDYGEYEGIYMGIDPAGRGKDELAYCIVAHLHGKLYLLTQGGLRGGYKEENLVTLSTVAKEYSVNKLFIEDNFGDGMFSTLLKPILHAIYPCTVEDLKATIQKELRIIDTLEPVLNQHRLVVDKGLVERDIKKALESPQNLPYSLFHQLTHITRDRGSLLHDDRLDVLAMVVKEWTRVLIQDPNEVLKNYKEKQRLQNIEHFMDVVKRNNNKNKRAISPALKGLNVFRM